MCAVYALIVLSCSPRSSITNAEARFVPIYTATSPVAAGSGTLLDSRGTVLTCKHIFNDPNFKAEFRRDGKIFPLLKIAESDAFDLALATSDWRGNPGPSITWKPQTDLNKGDQLFLIGAPFGLKSTYMQGYVSNPRLGNTKPAWPELEFIQSAGLSYPGNSGALVYTIEGSAIGVQQAAYGFAADTGIGLIIPSDMVTVFLEKFYQSENRK